MLNKLGVIVKEKPNARPGASKRVEEIAYVLSETGYCSLRSQMWCMTCWISTEVVAGLASWQWTSEMRSTTSQLGPTRQRPYLGKEPPKFLSTMCLYLVQYPPLRSGIRSVVVAAINPKVKMQIYVDDPILVYDEADPHHKLHLGVALLWAAVAGFPIKLEKSDAGSSVKRIGAQLLADDQIKAATITIPQEKVLALAE